MRHHNTDELEPVTVKIPADKVDSIKTIADTHGVSRSAVLRNAIEHGLRVPKYYPDEFPLEPELYEIDR